MEGKRECKKIPGHYTNTLALQGPKVLAVLARVKTRRFWEKKGHDRTRPGTTRRFICRFAEKIFI